MGSVRVVALIFIYSCIMDFSITADPAYAGSPEETLREYVDAMRNHNSNPDMDFYTQQTREMLRGWNVTTSQMDNIVKTYRGCTGGEILYDDSYSLAVIRYDIIQKQCSPWFFKNSNGNWLLDLTMMQRAIRFGPGNAWHFAAGLKHEYNFGFADWEFNSLGYPVSAVH